VFIPMVYIRRDVVSPSLTIITLIMMNKDPWIGTVLLASIFNMKWYMLF